MAKWEKEGLPAPPIEALQQVCMDISASLIKAIMAHMVYDALDGVVGGCMELAAEVEEGEPERESVLIFWEVGRASVMEHRAIECERLAAESEAESPPSQDNSDEN